ncbi:1-acyl-sn-glycerol-3-phosphate acyltransferase [Sphingosinicella sp. BN140058]|uniref:lysophospholipid acyltransferase family protein n=1 Tax=Sphingosinicella sp. BN140058 TaxID=1892855 RepID=UPI001011C0B3|nr:lysophospholipid acyltransferase family protein [Sphingosinicella sp. BN140058]QAY76098.1 1-acyl-sn-glycerol-3-phosphate acyltransferase [Sphingosinicella sp. BN140058]
MIRLVARVAAIVLTLLVCLPLHYGWRAVGRASPWPRRFLGAVGRIAGMRVEVRGTPLPSHVLFAANHLSWLDIMLIAGASGAAFVSRDDVGRWPVIGWLARLNATVFVDRSDRRAVSGQADTLRAALAGGQPVALFPEGTTDGGTSILPFRASLFSALFPPMPGIRVQPIAVDYGAAAAEIAWVGKEAAGANLRRILSRRGTNIVVLSFLAPIDPAAMPDRKALASRARDEILALLHPSEAAVDPL